MLYVCGVEKEKYVIGNERGLSDLGGRGCQATVEGGVKAHYQVESGCPVFLQGVWQPSHCGGDCQVQAPELPRRLTVQRARSKRPHLPPSPLTALLEWAVPVVVQ